MKSKPDRTVLVSRTKDRYLELIKQFPLRRLRDDADAHLAGEMASTLAVRGEKNLSPGERDYLDALTLILQVYEQHGHPIPADKRTPLQRLKYLMRESKMKSV